MSGLSNEPALLYCLPCLLFIRCLQEPPSQADGAGAGGRGATKRRAAASGQARTAAMAAALAADTEAGTDRDDDNDVHDDDVRGREEEKAREASPPAAKRRKAGSRAAAVAVSGDTSAAPLPLPAALSALVPEDTQMETAAGPSSQAQDAAPHGSTQGPSGKGRGKGSGGVKATGVSAGGGAAAAGGKAKRGKAAAGAAANDADLYMLAAAQTQQLQGELASQPHQQNQEHGEEDVDMSATQLEHPSSQLVPLQGGPLHENDYTQQQHVPIACRPAAAAVPARPQPLQQQPPAAAPRAPALQPQQQQAVRSRSIMGPPPHAINHTHSMYASQPHLHAPQPQPLPLLSPTPSGTATQTTGGGGGGGPLMPLFASRLAGEPLRALNTRWAGVRGGACVADTMLIREPVAISRSAAVHTSLTGCKLIGAVSARTASVVVEFVCCLLGCPSVNACTLCGCLFPSCVYMLSVSLSLSTHHVLLHLFLQCAGQRLPPPQAGAAVCHPVTQVHTTTTHQVSTGALCACATAALQLAMHLVHCQSYVFPVTCASYVCRLLVPCSPLYATLLGRQATLLRPALRPLPHACLGDACVHALMQARAPATPPSHTQQTQTHAHAPLQWCHSTRRFHSSRQHTAAGRQQAAARGSVHATCSTPPGSTCSHQYTWGWGKRRCAWREGRRWWWFHVRGCVTCRPAAAELAGSTTATAGSHVRMPCRVHGRL